MAKIKPEIQNCNKAEAAAATLQESWPLAPGSPQGTRGSPPAETWEWTLKNPEFSIFKIWVKSFNITQNMHIFLKREEDDKSLWSSLLVCNDF